ncbi:MAG: hypothetical protein IJA95_09940 [Bacteroidaceae bacterium]|nr:hypothetical protein [Bacteroidaceae bacterium]
MKIVYLLDSICVLGGVEQITITKANALANINNNIIYIIVAEHRGTPFMEVNSKVNVINLNIQYYRDKGDSKLQGYKILLEERHKHKNKLSKILNEIAPDIVISTGKSEQYIITSINIKSNPILIREFHESKLFWDIVSKTLFEKIYNKIRHFYQKHFILNKFDKLIILNEEEKKYWKYTKKLCVIPNPTNVNHPFISNVKTKSLLL